MEGMISSTYILHPRLRSFYRRTAREFGFLGTYTLALVLQCFPRGGNRIMLKCLMAMPVLLLAAGCSRSPEQVAAAAATPNTPGPIAGRAQASPSTPARSTLVIPNGTALH